MLSRGNVDLAVVAAPYDTEHLDGLCVGQEPWVAMIPNDHPLALRMGNSISLADLKDEALIIPQRASRVTAIRQWFHGVGVEPKIICKLSSYVNAIALVEQKVGICIFPQTTYTPN